MIRSRRASKAAISSLTAALAVCGVAIGLTASNAQAGDDGRAIMNDVAKTRKVSGSEAEIEMKTVDGKNVVSRKLVMATKLYSKGAVEKRSYRFTGPEDIKGTKVLVVDKETDADDVWIFMPALRKVRRIVASDSAKSFMGSEFSYGDLNIPPLNDYTYKVKGSAKVGGEDCDIVEVTPKNDDVKDADGYSRKEYWVSKGKKVIRKGIYYSKSNPKHAAKQLTTSNIQALGKGHYRPKVMEMKNLDTKRVSTFTTKKMGVSSPKDDFFTTSYLER